MSVPPHRNISEALSLANDWFEHINTILNSITTVILEAAFMNFICILMCLVVMDF